MYRKFNRLSAAFHSFDGSICAATSRLFSTTFAIYFYLFVLSGSLAFCLSCCSALSVNLSSPSALFPLPFEWTSLPSGLNLLSLVDSKGASPRYAAQRPPPSKMPQFVKARTLLKACATHFHRHGGAHSTVSLQLQMRSKTKQEAEKVEKNKCTRCLPDII